MPYSNTRLTPATEAFIAQQGEVATMNQQAASQDVIGQEAEKQKRFNAEMSQQEKYQASNQRQQEADQRKREAESKSQLAAAKRAGVLTQVNDVGQEQMKTHNDGAPVYQHGFQDGLKQDDQGGHVAEYRDPYGRRHSIPAQAIRTVTDAVGAPNYEFDIQGADGGRKTVRQPVGAKPLWDTDPNTGKTYTTAADPETGGTRQIPVGIDPVVAGQVAVTRAKQSFTESQANRKFEADQLRLIQDQQENTLRDLKTPLDKAQTDYDKLTKVKKGTIQYRQTPDGIVQDTYYDGVTPVTAPVPPTDGAGIVRAQAWLDQSRRAKADLDVATAAHTPIAAQVRELQKKRDALAVSTLNESHQTQLQIARMEKAQKAGIPVYQPDWQQRIAAMREDRRFTKIITEAGLDESGDPLAADVRRVSLPETSKLLNQVLDFSSQRDMQGAGVLRDGQLPEAKPMQRPPVSLKEQIMEGLTADNIAPKDADVKTIATQALGITDPDKWQIEETANGTHSLITGGQVIGEIDRKNNRLMLPVPSQYDTPEELERHQQRLLNAGKDGLPVYYSTVNRPLTQPQLRDLITQGIDISQKTRDPVQREAALNAAGLSPAGLRQQFVEGKLSVQDSRMLNEAFHGIKDVDTSKGGIIQGFQRWLSDGGAVSAAQFRNGDNTAKAEVLNRYFNQLTDASNDNIVRGSRQSLADARTEMLKPFAGPNFLGSGQSAGQMAKSTVVQMLPLIGRGIYDLTGASTAAGWVGLGTEADRLAWQQAKDENARRSGFLQRMMSTTTVRDSMLNLKSWANRAEPGAAIPDDIAQEIATAYYDGFHRFNDSAAAELDTTRDTFNVNKDPILKGLVERYLTTADPSTWDSLHSLLAMDARSRETQKSLMAYNDRPVVLTADKVIERGKGLDLAIAPESAGTLMQLGKALNEATKSEQATNIITQAAGILKLDPQNAALALSLLTTEENDDPNSVASLLRSGWASSTNEAVIELGSSIAEAGVAGFLAAPTGGASIGAVALERGSRIGVKTMAKAVIRRTLGAGINAMSERSALFAAGRAQINASRRALGAAVAKGGEAFANAGMAVPKFGTALTIGQKARNLTLRTGKMAVAGVIPEAIEEVVAETGSSDTTFESMGTAAAGGAYGSMVLSPIFSAIGSVSGARARRAIAAGTEKEKAEWVERVNTSMAGVPGFTPYVPADYDIVAGLSHSPLVQAAHDDFTAAQDELAAATQEHTENKLAAAGNATLPDSPRLLAAKAAADVSGQQLNALAGETYAATDELRALPPEQLPLYTGIAKAVSGATEYTDAEAKALIALQGDNAITFQQSQALPAGITGPENVSNTATAPSVTATAPGRYRLPQGTRINIPPQAITALTERAPSLQNLLGSDQAQPAPTQQSQPPQQPPATGEAVQPPPAGAESPTQATPAARPPSSHSTTTARLPRELSGAKPRYSYGSKGFELEFQSDLDRAAYITAQKTPSKRDADYVAWATQASGMSEAQVRAHGSKVRDYIKGYAAENPSGSILIPNQLPDVAKAKAPKKAAAKPLPSNALENIARSTIGAVMARSPKLKALIQESDTPNPYPTGGMWMRDDGTVAYHLPTLLPQLDSLTPQQAAQRVAALLDEEIRHAANMQSALRLWNDGNTNPLGLDFTTWRDAWYADIWQNHFTDEMRQQVMDAYGDTLPEQDWKRAMEGLRMLDQIRATGSITESVLRALDAVLETLREFLNLVATGSKPIIQAEIDGISTVLREFGYENGTIQPAKATAKPQKPRTTKAKKKATAEPAAQTEPAVAPAPPHIWSGIRNGLPAYILRRTVAGQYEVQIGNDQTLMPEANAATLSGLTKKQIRALPDSPVQPTAQPQNPRPDLTSPTVQVGDIISDSRGSMGPVVSFTSDGTPVIGMEGDSVGDVVPDPAVGGWKLEQAAPAPSTTTQTSTSDTTLDAGDAALKDAFQGLFSAPSPTSQVDLPKERRDAMMKAASALIDAGVKTPADLAARLDRLAPNGALRQYSRSFWRLMSGFDSTLAESPDWSAIYASIGKPLPAVEEPAGEAVTVVEAPPQADTPAEAEAKVEDQVEKVAATEGTRDAKSIKNDIITKLEGAIEDFNNGNSEPDSVTFHIPGDGTFTIPNHPYQIKELLKRVKRLPVKDSFALEAPKASKSKTDEDSTRARKPYELEWGTEDGFNTALDQYQAVRTEIYNGSMPSKGALAAFDAGGGTLSGAIDTRLEVVDWFKNRTKQAARVAGIKWEPEQDESAQQETMTAPVAQSGVQAADSEAHSDVTDIESLRSLIKRLNTGAVTAAQMKEGWEQFKANEVLFRAELGKMPKDELLNWTGMSARKSDKKERLIDSAIHSMESVFNPGDSLQYDPMEENANRKALDRAVSGWTDDIIKKKAADIQSRADAKTKALSNPETLEEWTQFVRKAGVSKPTAEESATFKRLSSYQQTPWIMERGERSLTPAQLAAYDAVRGKQRKDGQNYRDESKAIVYGVQANTSADIIETKHTQKGHDLFVVKLGERVDRSIYDRLNSAAKKLGGYYSAYTKGGAVAGFQFTTRANAEQFQAVTKGETVDNAAAVTAKREAKKSAAAERLVVAAESLEAKAEAELGKERQTNTRKRAGQAANKENEARGWQAKAQTMRNLAAAMESGEAKHLDGVRNAAQVSELDVQARMARAAGQRGQNMSYSDRLKHDETPIQPEEMDAAEVPFPYFDKSTLLQMVELGRQTPGAKLIAERVAKIRMNRNEGEAVSLGHQSDIDEVRDLSKKVSDRGRLVWDDIAWKFERFDRLNAMGLTDLPSLRAALREFVQFRKQTAKPDPIKAMERALIGTKIPGFFPTPAPIIDDMVSRAQITSGMRVLEPSAGKGDIAEAARDAGADVDTMEISSSLRDILKAKGLETVASDFMEESPRDEYDAVLMNPPFENGQDAQHVMHAYQFLKPGGTLVAIMGEGSFFRSDKKAQAFRDWLDDHGGSEKLPDNSFNGSDAFRQTGTATRMVTVQKPVTPDSLASSPRYRTPSDMLAQTALQMQGMDRPAVSAKASVPTSSIVTAYRAAQVGQSSVWSPIKTVFEKAQSADPTLTPQAFMQAVNDLNDASRLMVNLVERQETVNAAKPFVVGAAGVEMAFDADTIKAAAIVSNLDRVKAVRPLLKDEQAAYDKAGEMLADVSAGETVARPPVSHVMPDGYELTGPGLHTLNSSPIRAFHGTPHKVDKFSTDKIGTGEGNQAYGWGLYFAGNSVVAEGYRKGLTERDFIRKVKEVFSEFDTPDDAMESLDSLDLSEGQRGLLRALEKDDWLGFDYPHQAIQAAIREPGNFDLSPETVEALKIFGNLYTVDLLPDESEFLDWDKPLSEQSDKVKGVISPIVVEYGLPLQETGSSLYFATQELEGQKGGLGSGSAPLDWKKFAPKASRRLASIGIPGIRYLDGGSRGFKQLQWIGTPPPRSELISGVAGNYLETTNGDLPQAIIKLRADAKASGASQYAEAASALESGELKPSGTSNYVLFDESLVKILEENGKPVSPPTLASAPVQRSGGEARIVATPEQDAEYMQAIESGDVAKQQAMVGAAAKAAGVDRIEIPGGIPTSKSALISMAESKGIAVDDSSSYDLHLDAPSGYIWSSNGRPSLPIHYATNSQSWWKQGLKEEWPNIKDGLELVTDKKRIDEIRYDIDEDEWGGIGYPVSFDASGNVIPLSQRFNLGSNSILRSAPAPDARAAQVAEILSSMQPIYRDVLQDTWAGKSIDAIATARSLTPVAVGNILRVANGRFNILLNKAATKPTVQVENGIVKAASGRPDLAGSGTSIMAAIDQNRPTPDVVHQAEMRDIASTLFSGWPAESLALTKRWMDSGGMLSLPRDLPAGMQSLLNEAEARGALPMLMQASANHALTAARLSNAPLFEQARLALAQRELGTEQARAFGMRQDTVHDPMERQSLYLQKMLVMPNDSQMKALRENPGMRDRILADIERKAQEVKNSLKAMGYDLDAWFAEQQALDKEAETFVPEPVKQPLRMVDPAARSAIKAMLSGTSLGDAANQAGIAIETLRAAYNALREAINAQALKAAAQAKDDALRSAPAPSFDHAAAVGLPVLPDSASASFKLTDTPKTRAYQIRREKASLNRPDEVAAALSEMSAGQSGYIAKVSEFWRMSILSGPQTWVVNAGSGLVLGLYKNLVQRLGSAALADIVRATGMSDLPNAPALKDALPVIKHAYDSFVPSLRNAFRSWKHNRRLFDLFANGQLHLDPGAESAKWDFNKSGIVVDGKEAIFKGEHYRPALSRAKWYQPGSVMDAISFRMLLLADEFVRSWNGRIEMAAQMRELARSEPALKERTIALRKQAQAALPPGYTLRYSPNNGTYYAVHDVERPFAVERPDGSQTVENRKVSERASVEDWSKLPPGLRDSLAINGQKLKMHGGLNGLLGANATPEQLAARMEVLDKPGSAAWLKAIESADTITAQTPLGSGQRLVDALDGVADLVLKGKKSDYAIVSVPMAFLFPFVSTPVNLFKNGVTMSPLGGLFAIVDAVRAHNRRKAGNLESADKIMNASRALEEMVNQVVAWGVVAVVSQLVRPDDDEEDPAKRLPWITGTAPWPEVTQGRRDLLNRVAPPSSIRIGDTWFSYNRIDPFAISIAGIVDAILEHERNPGAESLFAVMVNAKNAMQDKTFLAGFGDLTNLLSDPRKYGPRWAAGIATGFIPNLIRQPIRSADDTWRDSSIPKSDGLIDGLVRRAQYSVTPQSAPPKVDIWGRTATKDTGTGGPNSDFAARLLFPMAMQSHGLDPLDVALHNYNMTADKPFAVTPPDRIIIRTVNGQKVKEELSQPVYDEFLRSAGQAARAALGTQYNAKVLDDNDVEAITKTIRDIQSQYRDAAFAKAMAAQGQ